MGWLITFAVVFALAILPLGVDVRYDTDGIRVKIVFGVIKLTVFPIPSWLKRKKKAKKPKPQAEKTEETAIKEEPSEPGKIEPDKEEKPKAKKGSLMDFLPLVKLAVSFLGDFRRKLRIRRLELTLIMAGGDPCDLAVNYGRTWAAAENLTAVLERAFVIKKRDIQVGCDFTADSTMVVFHGDIIITLGHLIALAVVYGIRALRIILKIKKNRNKAVQTK